MQAGNNNTVTWFDGTSTDIDYWRMGYPKLNGPLLLNTRNDPALDGPFNGVYNDPSDGKPGSALCEAEIVEKGKISLQV